MAAMWVATQVGGAYAQTVLRTVSLSPPPRPGEPVGIWSGGAFLGIDNHDSGTPILSVYDQSGAEIQRVAVQIPGAQLVTTVNNQFARSADGYLAVTGSAYGLGDRAANFLAVISPDGANQTVVRTDPYAPRALTFVSDGTIWTAGLEKNTDGIYKEGKYRENADYFVIRRFDRSGRLLGTNVPRTSLPEPAPLEGSQLVASKDRVGWFSPMARQYKEFSLDGKELASYRHSVSLYDDAGIALCDDGGVWLSVKADSTGKTGDTMLVSLNRDLGTWSIGKNQPGGVYLLGCAGTTLVAAPTSDHLQWMATR
jgi:hypothetical protein